MTHRREVVVGLSALALSTRALAGPEEKPMTDRKSPAPPASTLAYQEHVGRASLALSVVYTHDADRDFLSLLAGHRRSLIELAKLELQHGADAATKALAHAVLDDAERQAAAAEAIKK